MAQDVAAEVQNEAVVLAGVQPEAAADHLVVEARRDGRPQHRHAVDVRGVEARGQHVDVAQVLELPRAELARASPARSTRRRVAADEAALDAVLG